MSSPHRHAALLLLLASACQQQLPILVANPLGMKVCPGDLVLPTVQEGETGSFNLTIRGYDDLVDMTWLPGVTSDLTIPEADRNGVTWLEKIVSGCGDFEFTYRLGSLTPTVDVYEYPDEGGLLKLMFDNSADVYVRVSLSDDVDPASVMQTSCDLDPLIDKVPCPDPDAQPSEVLP